MGAGSAPAGWYPDVERPGDERYWNGSSWTEDRRAGPDEAARAAPSLPPPVFAQPAAPVGDAPDGAQTPTYPGNGLAGWGLALSLLGLFCCGITCVPGAIMGLVHLQRVERGERAPSSRGLGLAAAIIGGVGIGLYVVAFGAIALFGLTFGP